MWWEIIKNQSLATSQLGASMDWENEEIPDEEDDDCKMWLKGLCDILGSEIVGLDFAFHIVNLEKIPENVACDIKEFYTRPVSSYWDISTNSGENIDSFRANYTRGGQYKELKKFDIIIETHFRDDFSVFLSVRDINNNHIIYAGKEGIDYRQIFGDEEDIEENPSKLKKQIEELFDGKHEITKQLCSFVKKYFEYIGKPSLKEEFLDDYADWWFWAEDKIHEIKNPSERLKQYEEAIKKYW